MEGINYNLLPHFDLFFQTVFIGLLVVGVYLVLKRLLLPLPTTDRPRTTLYFRLDFVEKMFWPLFFILIGISLILSHAIVGLTLFVFITGILWRPLNNYFLGLIFRVGKNYKVGQRIRYRNTQGTIRAFNNMSLEMELEGGEYLDIPYRHFAGADIFRTSSKSGIMSYSITLPVAKPCDLEAEKRQIKTWLLSMPWVLPNQKMVIEHLADEPDRYLLKITVHGIDKNHLYKVENALKNRFRAAEN
ncbi:MAG: hypothetical protein D6714_12360 [Bacteroidetes bacterium]|nr:MAG: hypothetical protein D6714_12360 [Bacteroidota bacterium]